MKLIKTLPLFVLALLVAGSCRKDEDPQNNGPRAVLEKTTANTFEVVTIKALESLAERYTGQLGGQSVEILQTSDSVLSFIVPDVAAGEHTLSFDLGEFKIQVLKTREVDMDSLSAAAWNEYDIRMSLIQPQTPGEYHELDSMRILKQNVLDLFNRLTAEEKRQAALFYEANRVTFETFSKNVYANLDSPVVFKKQTGNQSSCPKSDFKTFYNCTSGNLTTASNEFRESLKAVVGLVAMAGVIGGVGFKLTAIVPGAVFLTGAVMALPLVAATYLGLVEILPAANKLRKALLQYLTNPWVFSKELYNNMKTEYGNEEFTDLNLDARFKTISSDDGDATPKAAGFIKSFNSLIPVWEKVKGIFGSPVGYSYDYDIVNLEAGDIKVSNIDNPFVKLFEQEGEKVKFKTTNGKKEVFNYTIKVTKQGFVREYTLTATVLERPVVKVTSVTVFPDKFFSSETSGYVHSSNIDLQIDFIGDASEFAIVKANTTPKASDWISTIPIQNKITYNYQASFAQMAEPGIWDLKVYLRQGQDTSMKPLKVRYTTIVPHTPVVDPSGNTANRILGIPAALQITDVYVHTFIDYQLQLLNLCDASQSHTGLYMLYLNSLGDPTGPFNSTNYGVIRFYDSSGNLLETLSPAPFAFYARRCIPKGTTYHHQIAYAEILYANN